MHLLKQHSLCKMKSLLLKMQETVSHLKCSLGRDSTALREEDALTIVTNNMAAQKRQSKKFLEGVNFLLCEASTFVHFVKHIKMVVPLHNKIISSHIMKIAIVAVGKIENLPSELQWNKEKEEKLRSPHTHTRIP